eukprot:SAG11_NODE_4_length_33019_cov_28.098909_1_plen_225_part_10
MRRVGYMIVSEIRRLSAPIQKPATAPISDEPPARPPPPRSASPHGGRGAGRMAGGLAGGGGTFGGLECEPDALGLLDHQELNRDFEVRDQEDALAAPRIPPPARTPHTAQTSGEPARALAPPLIGSLASSLRRRCADSMARRRGTGGAWHEGGAQGEHGTEEGHRVSMARRRGTECRTGLAVRRGGGGRGGGGGHRGGRRPAPAYGLLSFGLRVFSPATCGGSRP